MPSTPADCQNWLLRLTEPQTGDPFRALPWQQQWLEAFLEPGVRVAILSTARGAGKSTWAAALAALFLAGPLAGRGTEIALVSGSREQSRIVFRQLRALVDAPPGRSTEWRSVDTPSQALLEHRATGNVVRILPAAPERLHGLIASLIIADEPAQWPRRQRDAMWSAIETSLGKLEGARAVALGTQSHERDSWWFRFCNGEPPARSLVTVYSAPMDAEVTDPAAWRAANPSLDYFPALEAEYEATASQLSDAAQPAFRNLRLNQPVEMQAASLLVTAEEWRACQRDAAREGRYALGIDLAGTGHSWSGLAAYWPSSGRLEAVGVVPEVPSLVEREAASGVAPGCFRRWHEAGALVTIGRRITPVTELLAWARETWGVPGWTTADYFRRAEAEEACADIGFPRPLIAGSRIERDNLAKFREVVRGRRIAWHGDNGWWADQVQNARTVVAGGHERLARGSEGGRRQTARDDGLTAAVRAVARGEAMANRKQPAFAWAV